MYSQPVFNQADITVKALNYIHPSFTQTLISLFGLNYLLKAYKQITIKQGLFGETYVESATQLIINKSDLAINQVSNNTAESLLASLIMKALVISPNFNNTTAELSSIEFNQNKITTTVWLSFYDQPVDQYNNPDISQPFDPDNY